MFPPKAPNEDSEDNSAQGLQDSRQIITEVQYRMSKESQSYFLSVLAHTGQAGGPCNKGFFGAEYIFLTIMSDTCT